MVSELRRMTVGELRREYAEVFGEQTRSFHKEFLVRRIAWRIQANAEGGLPDRARRRAHENAAAPPHPARSGPPSRSGRDRSFAVVVRLLVVVFGVRVGLGSVPDLTRGVHHCDELGRVLVDVLLAVLAAEADEPAPNYNIDGLAHVAPERLLAHGAGLERIVLPLCGDNALIQLGQVLGGVLQEVGLLALCTQPDEAVAVDELEGLGRGGGKVLAGHDRGCERIKRGLVLDDRLVELGRGLGKVLLKLRRAAVAAEADLAAVIELDDGLAHGAQLAAADGACRQRVGVAHAGGRRLLGRFGLLCVGLWRGGSGGRVTFVLGQSG
ncbi:MAG: DUF2924 domain-containing protein [Phycisphaerales bacterium]|nr:DUF2924 domain-containing protein [Phycisphaerales bacterium]